MTITEHGITRRGLLAGAGGLSFAFTFGLGTPHSRAQNEAAQLGAYVHIAADGGIRLYAPAAEMGQGVQTIVPLIIAEELDADWADVTVKTAPVAPAFAHPIFRGQYTVASLTVKGYWMPARIAGAQARRALMQAAADEWGVDPADVTTEASAVLGPDGQRLSYGEIAGLAIVPAELPEIAPDELKPVSAFRILGQDHIRVDMLEKSTGTATYAVDVNLPGVVAATVVHGPSAGAEVAGHNGEVLRDMPGVLEVVDLGYGVGIVGMGMAQTLAARAALDIRWTDTPEGPPPDTETDLDDYLAQMHDNGRAADVVYSEAGDAIAALRRADRVVTREYRHDYCYHAQLEPTACTAWVRDGRVEVWTGTQWQSNCVQRAADAAGVDPADVVLHQLYVGGGFGRRAHTEYVRDAVALSAATGRPVRMIQSRADDMHTGWHRPLVAQRLDLGLDAQGRITALRHRVACQPVTPGLYGMDRWAADQGRDLITMRGSSAPHYAIPDQRAEHLHQWRGTRVGAVRGVGCGYTKFALESAVDQIARSLGRDPLDYRIDMAGSDRARRVLERVGELSGWHRLRGGAGLGVAFAEYGDSLTAVVVQIALDGADAALRVRRIWAVIDPGLPLQPDTIRAQMEGGLLFGMSMALKERLRFVQGVPQASNFHDYDVLRMDEVPEIAVDILRSGDVPFEVGELGVPAIAPAIANAFAAITGKYPDRMPLTPERIRALRGS